MIKKSSPNPFLNFSDSNCIIVPDCRFNNEFEALKDKGFIFMKIRNPNGEKDSHDSENQAVNIADKHFDYVIDNNEDLEKLFYICKDIYHYLYWLSL